MELSLKGKVAVVTGASKGIGLAVVRGLVEEGVHVTAGALSSSTDLDELAMRADVQVIEVDLAGASGPGTLVAAAGDRLDILVNNVGAAPIRLEGFLSVTDDQWYESFTLNAMAAIRATRRALPPMLDARHGAIVNVASVNALLPDPV